MSLLSLLHAAAKADNLPHMQELVAAGADINGRYFLMGDDDEDRPPPTLHRAAEYGHVAVARFLIERGARRDATSRGELTAMHVASIRARIEVVRLLIEHGAMKLQL